VTWAFDVDQLTDFLELNGPSLSSEIVRHLVEDQGVLPAAARKRVSRVSGDIKRLAGIVFPHKARFFYLQRQFGSPEYWTNLADALISTNSAYGYAIAALRQRDGVIPVAQFTIDCGSPLRQQRQLSPDTIFTRLSDAKLLTKVVVPGVGECVALVQHDKHYSSGADLMRARLVTENILLIAVKDWLRKLGIASFGQVALRSDEVPPKVGTFAWDLSAPCYLGHMVRKGPDGAVKPGFVTCDVYLGNVMAESGVAPFVRKCLMLRSLRKVGPCMQIIVANRFQHDAFHLLKRHGIIPATPKSLFGEEVAQALAQLTSVLDKAARSVIDPAQFDELFSKLSKIEGAATQLRGTLFEYLAADLARKTLAPEVSLNRIFKVLGKEAEADIVAVRPHQAITLIECKGYSPRATIPDSLFKRWLEHNVPTCYAALKQHPDWKGLPATFEFWATAPLTDDALALFARAKVTIRPTRYTIKLKLGPDLQREIKKTKDSSLITAFEKHFVKIEREPRGFPHGHQSW
jgi:hypothetical protein